MTSIESKAAFQALAGMAGSHPLVRVLLKYWWLSLPASLALYGLLRARHKKGDLNMPGVMQDLGLSLGPAIGLIMLSESVITREASSPNTLVASGPVRDAQFVAAPIKQAEFAQAATTPSFR